MRNIIVRNILSPQNIALDRKAIVYQVRLELNVLYYISLHSVLLYRYSLQAAAVFNYMT